MSQRIEKKWVLQDPVPQQVKERLKRHIPIMQQILYNRGISSEEEAERYLNTDSSFYDPYLFNDMEKAIQRVIQAIDSHEKIAVFGDYDADGITSTVVMSEALEFFGADVQPYLPERDDGYGVNTKAIEYLYNQGISLVITVDCGIRSPEELKFAKDLGMTVIVTDHHEPAAYLPDVHSIICPKVEGENYPEKNLAGVGVAFKFVQALFLAKSELMENADRWLDLVAIGTVADVVPLLGENRLLVAKGLRTLRFTERLGLKSLIGVSGLEASKLSAFDISFGIAPRLNAAGRMDSPMKALNLLVSRKPSEIVMLSQELDDLNKYRQNETIKIHELAQKSFDKDRWIITVLGKDFNAGLVGLVSAKLTESFYRPSIVGFMGDEFTRASCRSIPEFHITQALDRCEHLLIRHGGHALAAGFTVENEKISELIETLEKIAEEELTAEDLKPRIMIDMEIGMRELPEDILMEFDKLEPIGADNPMALFLSRDVKVVHARAVGKKDNHLKLKIRDADKNYDAIAFNQGDWIKDLPKLIDIVYSIERNHYNGNIYKQLKIKDIKASSLSI